MSLPTYNFTARVGDYFQGNFNAGTVSNDLVYGYLPQGIEIGYNNGFNLTGRISGAYGSFSARVRRTYSSGFQEETWLNFEIDPGAPLLISGQILSHKYGTDFSKTFALENAAGRPVDSWEINGLPEWATYDPATGVITGTPTGVQDYAVTITVTSAVGSDTKTATLSIGYGYPEVEPDQVFICKVGEPFSARPILLEEEFRPANSWLVPPLLSPLPSGLSLNGSTGVISGTPTIKAGRRGVYFYITGPGGTMVYGTASQLISFEVSAGVPIIIAGQSATGTVGLPFAKTFAISDSKNRPVTSWSATGLPSWATLDASTGAISGTPQDSETSAISLTATGPGGSRTETVSISIAAGKPIIVSGQAFAGKVGEFFTAQILLQDEQDRPASSWSSNVAGGLTISNSGVLSGTPTTIVNRPYLVTASSAVGSDFENIQLTITAGAPDIPSPQYFTAYIGEDFVFTPQTINAGNRPVDSWQATDLPEWATLDVLTGTITGSPTEVTVAQITLTGTGPGGSTESTLELRSALKPILPAGQKFYTILDTPFQAQPEVLNKNLTETYIYSAQGLPQWATIDAGTGTISGNASTPATYPVTYTITDSLGNSVSEALDIIALGGVPTISESQAFTARTGYPVSYQATVVDQLAPASTWVASSLPAGLTITDAGTISGTPTVPGVYTITLEAANEAGVATPTALEIVIKHWNIMKIYIDPQKKRFLDRPNSRYPIASLDLKRRDKMPFELFFIEGTEAVDLPTSSEITVGIKARFEDTTYLALVPHGTSTLDLNTDAIEAEFAADNPESIIALLEVRWADEYASSRSVTLPVNLNNSVIRDERDGQ